MSETFNQLSDEGLLDLLMGTGSEREWEVVKELRARLGERLPERLLERYRSASKWQVRNACVYHSLRYARVSELAVDLALIAVKDKAQIVRYRACMLLALSQRADLLPKLKTLESQVPSETKEDVFAAIDAIELGNRNFFVDRDHSGKVSLNIH